MLAYTNSVLKLGFAFPPMPALAPPALALAVANALALAFPLALATGPLRSTSAKCNLSFAELLKPATIHWLNHFIGVKRHVALIRIRCGRLGGFGRHWCWHWGPWQHR